MQLNTIVTQLALTRLTPTLTAQEKADVARGYASDLLSDVLANAPGGGLLVTVQAHVNALAVALHAGLAGVVFASGHVPDGDVVAKAAEEGMPLYTSGACTFEIVGQLYALGLRGPQAASAAGTAAGGV